VPATLAVIGLWSGAVAVGVVAAVIGLTLFAMAL
jgi:hypothetical protein